MSVTCNKKYTNHVPRTFADALKTVHLDDHSRCASLFGKLIIEQIHSLKGLETFEIPYRIFIQMVCNAGIFFWKKNLILVQKNITSQNSAKKFQIASLVAMQEIVESSVINLLKHGVKCAQHAHPSSAALTVKDLEFVNIIKHYNQDLEQSKKM